MKKNSIWFFIFFLITFPLFAAPQVDIVETKDGNKFIGVIIENYPNDKLKIQLNGGSIISVSYTNIIKISKGMPEQAPGYHQHTGFYLSLNAGLSQGFSNFKLDEANMDVNISGMGPAIDFKIGGAPIENLIISFDLISGGIMAPAFSGDGSDNTEFIVESTLSQSMGIGITYYFMPQNIFISGSILGMGSFGFSQTRESTALTNQDEDDTYALVDAKGYGFYFKIGKEFWTGKNWGLGVSAFYNFMAVSGGEVGPGNGLFEEGRSNRFGILFNTTYN